MSNLYWGAELPIYQRLTDCSLLPIIAAVLVDYEKQTGVEPSILLIQRSLKAPLIRELVQRGNQRGMPVDPNKLVVEPMYFGRIPVVFTLKANRDEWIIARNSSVGYEASL